MKKILMAMNSFLICFSFFSNSFADPWKLSVNSNLLLTLNLFSNNWVGGDAGTFSWETQGIGVAEKLLTKTLTDRNTLKLSFGQTKIQNKETKNWSAPIKSTDLIDFESLFKWSLGWYFEPYAALNLLSEFSDQRDPSKTFYLNPMDIKESGGVLREIVKNPNTSLTARLGITVHQLIDRNRSSAGPGPITGSSQTVDDGGVELVSELKTQNQPKNIHFSSLLKLYEAVVSSQSSNSSGLKNKNDWRYPHLNWENILSLNVAKYVMLNVYGQILYDKPIDSKFRLKETLSLGLTYSYDNTSKK